MLSFLSPVTPWIRYVRARLRRSRLATAAAALLTAVVVASAFSTVTGQVEARARLLGGWATVPVTTRSIAAGDVIGPGDFEIKQLVRSAVPQSDLVVDPRGRVALTALVPGDILISARLAPDGLSGPAALLPPGSRAVAVERSATTPPVKVGDRVDLYATLPPEEAAGAPSFAVARHALVVHVGDEATTVAVTADETPPVVYALATGSVALVLTGR